MLTVCNVCNVHSSMYVQTSIVYTIPVTALRNFLSLCLFGIAIFFRQNRVCVAVCVIFRYILNLLCSFTLFMILLRSALYICRASNSFVSLYIFVAFYFAFFPLFFLKSHSICIIFSDWCKSTFQCFKWKSLRILCVCARGITFANKPRIFIVNK